MAPCMSGAQKQELTRKRFVHVIYDGSALGEPEAMKRGGGEWGQEEPGRARSQQSPSLA